ncbi:MAG: carbohydrate ABC transporter permease [Spirochaetia bacterium]
MHAFRRAGAVQRTVGQVFAQLAVAIVAAVFLLPLLIVVGYSFKTTRELYLGSPLSLPQSLNWENYANALYRLNMGTSFLNTLFYTGVSVLILAVFAGAASWAIARNRGRFFKFSYIYFIIGILIPYQALFLPIYIIGYSLHLTNTAYGVILMYVATGMSFGVFLMTSFMSTVPVELEEAARVDGSSLYRTFFSIVIPLLRPAMATLIIMESFLIWNDYLMASLYVSTGRLRTLTVAIQSLFSQQTNDYTSAMSAIVISVLPIATLFVALQRYFIKGMTVGALKG